MVVVVLDGFLGDRKKHLDVTELVNRAMGELPDCRGVTVIEGRGGAGILKFNKIYRKLVRHAKHNKVLLLVGKSYGAHWCVRLLWKLAKREHLFKFHAVGMVTVDPSYVLHPMQRKMKSIPQIDCAQNFHQYGPRSGYLLGPPAENTAIRGDHATIERDPRVFRAIVNLLLWGHVKRRRR